ncbi:hypothetical protein BCR44DRAFT_1329545 [Catenaria anguillulae PL171]|uniref:Inhibitor I9 domain-containing protein n=1 Tax=Catenaria anguillulae PL171 TaxID=765915 RepID=A0A1Y2H6K3_9FUNG|nr:hypothetical protein BCR44DRAFT_1329545 [Catenaria anguillulae PL171]
MTLMSTHTQQQLRRRVGQQAASFHFPWMRLCLAFLVLVAVASRLSYAAPAPQDAGVSAATDSSLSSSAEAPSATPNESESTPTSRSGTNLDPETAPSAAPSVIDASTSVEATATSASATPSSALPPPSTVSDTQPSPHPSQEPQPTTPTTAAPSMAALVTPTLTPANSGTNSTGENVTTNNTDTPASQARNFTSSSAPAPDAIANSYIIVFKDGNFATTAARLTTEIESANVSPAGTIPLAPSAIVPPSAAAAMVSAVNASAPVDPEVSTSDIRAAEVRVPAGRAPTRFRNGRPVPAFDVNNPPNQITQAYPDLAAMAAVLTPDVARRLEQRSDVAEVVRDAQVKAAGWVVKQDDAPSWGTLLGHDDRVCGNRL